MNWLTSTVIHESRHRWQSSLINALLMKILFTILIIGLTSVMTYAEPKSPKTKRVATLYKSVIYANIPEYSAVNIDVNTVPEHLRSRFVEYRERNSKFRSELSKPKVSQSNRLTEAEFIADAVLEKKQGVEKAIVSLVKADGIEDIAADYARNSVLAYEWEGFSDGPLAEAKFAEKYLITDPETPIKPYLFLFLIHRYKHAINALDYEKRYYKPTIGAEEYSAHEAKQKSVSDKYFYYLNLAKKSPDPLVVFIADYIDKQEFLE